MAGDQDRPPRAIVPGADGASGTPRTGGHPRTSAALAVAGESLRRFRQQPECRGRPLARGVERLG